MTTIQEASKKIADARAELKAFAETQGKAAIGAAFKPFFEQFEEAESIKWTQYTPHFNDGDACAFSVHEPEVLDAYGEGIPGKWSSKKSTEPEALWDAFDEIWGSIDEDLLEACFGDGVKVTITATDVTVEEYDHD